MTSLCKKMNHVIREWKQFYDLMGTVKIGFSEKPSGMLCLNDLDLCLGKDLNILSSEFDAESISYYFADRTIEVSVSWPEDKAPYVFSAAVSYIFLVPSKH